MKSKKPNQLAKRLMIIGMVIIAVSTVISAANLSNVYNKVGERSSCDFSDCNLSKNKTAADVTSNLNVLGFIVFVSGLGVYIVRKVKKDK